VIRGDDNLLRLIMTKVADGTLVISQAGDFNSHRGIQVRRDDPVARRRDALRNGGSRSDRRAR
jgi:hypothetical protein